MHFVVCMLNLYKKEKPSCRCVPGPAPNATAVTREQPVRGWPSGGGGEKAAVWVAAVTTQGLPPRAVPSPRAEPGLYQLPCPYGQVRTFPRPSAMSIFTLRLDLVSAPTHVDDPILNCPRTLERQREQRCPRRGEGCR